MQFGHAVEIQGRWKTLKGQTAQYDGGDIAAIDRQSCIAGQGGGVIVEVSASARWWAESNSAGTTPSRTKAAAASR